MSQRWRRSTQCIPAARSLGEDAIALQLAMPGVLGLLHARGGMILIRVTEDEAEVLTLAVAPEARRQGVAGALLAAAMAAARAQAARTMVWKWRSATPQHARCMSARGLWRPAGGRAITPTAAMR